MTRSVFRFEYFTTRQDLAVAPEYSAVCVSGADEACGEKSGPMDTADDVDHWMRRHMAGSRHRHFRRAFVDFAELVPAAGSAGVRQVRDAEGEG